MTRIIAGQLRGRVLRVPRTGTRPTSDRVREALFSRLEHLGVVAGARVLDLFAGSGALGLEAASRGAASVLLVEKSRAAAQVARANVAELGLENVQVLAADVLRYLDTCPHRFDLVFADPPYDLPGQALTEVLAALVPRLDPGATVVLERPTRAAPPDWPAPLIGEAAKAYGETTVYFGKSPR